MDRYLQDLRRHYRQESSHQNAMRLAGALLRTAPLTHYRALAQQGDAEAQGLLPYLHAIFLFEDVFNEFVLDPNGEIFFADPITSQRKNKFVNAYCSNTSVASALADTVAEAVSIKEFLISLFKDNTFRLPPEQLRLDKAAARIYGVPEVLVATVYRDVYCSAARILVEDEAAFDFSTNKASPVNLWTLGSKQIQMRPLTEEDYTTLDDDYTYEKVIKDYPYEELPDFAKAHGEIGETGIPTFVMAGLVTRGSVMAIDGPAYVDFTDPIAKIYAGYIPPLWHEGLWVWTETVYHNVCTNTAERVAASIQQSSEEGIILHRRELEPCPEAGLIRIENQPRERCPHCRNYSSSTLVESRQLALREDAPPGTPPPPDHLNRTLDFLQRLYQNRIWGNISSVRGGQNLAVFLRLETYGPGTAP